MNDQSGSFPPNSAALPGSGGAQVPAIMGLREVALGGTPAAKAERGFDVTEYWRVVRKWWWLILAITLAGVMAAVVVSLMMTPQYEAAATLEVNPEGVQVVKMEALEPMARDDRSFIATQAGLLRSRSLAERVARSLNLANNENFADPESPRAAKQDQAVRSLIAAVEVEPERDSRLMRISAETPDPVLSARIANSYADNFIQSNLERRFEATAYARSFLEQRIATVKAKLEQSERALVAYAQRQGIISLNTDSGNGAGGRTEQSIDAASLVSLNESLSSAKAERIAAEQRFRQAQANRSTTEVLANPTVQALTSQRAQLEAQYQEKLGIFQPDYPEMAQMRARIQALDRSIRQETGNVSSALRSEYAAAVARENALQARVSSLKAGLLNLRERSIQYTILQREVDTNRSLYDALLQRFKEVGVAGGVGTNNVSVVDRAQTPVAPVSPKLPLNIAIGLFGGLLLGFGSAFAIEWIDDTIKTPDDLIGKLTISSLGVIPIIVKGGTVQEELEDRRSQVSEAYQSVRAALQFSTEHGVPRSLLITSTRAAEGKSSTALAISQTLASLGSNVLLIDGDLRKPTFRGPPGSVEGLSRLLAGDEDVQAAIHPTEVERLFLLPGGTIPPNPAELLASGRFEHVLEEVTKHFDHVIVDGPPVLGLADAPLLSATCEGTLMVIESGSIRRGAALNAVQRLRSAGARITGGVLTKFNAARTGYGYGYGYGYGEKQYAYREGETPKKQISLLKSP
jgi:capsular exopolysaccharide synthesis family protein